VKVSIHARDVRTDARPAGAFCLIAVAALALGCAGSAPGPASKPTSSGPAAADAEPDLAAGAREQRDAQKAWCNYLEALYLRAAEGATRWPRFHQCTEVTTMASPAMLHATADCALHALRQFEGNPFTNEHALEVSRCGAIAIEQSTASPTEIAPVVATICGRLVQCEDVDYAECRQGVVRGLGDEFRKAIGAMNQRGRAELRACLGKASCEELTTQISACIQPIMESLLWLPG
jgi:hypothetical protein